MTATLICDEEFLYATELTAGPVGLCRLRAWRRDDGSYVAAVTELHRGLDLAAGAPWLWGAVRARLSLPLGTLLYSFEHDARAAQPWQRALPQRYDLALRKYQHVERRPADGGALVALIGLVATD